MDLMCFHSSEKVRNAIFESLKEMDFNFECFPLLSPEEIEKKVRDKNPHVLMVELNRDNIKNYEKFDKIVFAIPLIKSIDREIALNLEDMGVDYLSSDSLGGFKENLMKVLIKNEDKVGEFLKEERIFKNIIYGFGFSWGHTFIVTMENRDSFYPLIPKFSEGIKVFVAMRESPKIFEENENLKVIWITDIVGKNRIKPHNLTILTDNIIKFLEGNTKRIVVIDCLEYLLLYNDFVNVVRNVELINSYAMEYNSLVILIIDNNAYTTKEYSLLKRYSILWKGE